MRISDILRSKGEEIKPICSKYCSKGSHHGRSNPSLIQACT